MWLSEAIDYRDNPHRFTFGSREHLSVLRAERHRQVLEEASQYTERQCATGALEDHMAFQVDEAIRKQRWIRDTLKKHGRVTRLHTRQGEVEPWNSVHHAVGDYIGDDIHREELCALEDRFPAENEEIRYITLEFEESSGLILVTAPEAQLYFNGDAIEDALIIMETLEPMDSRARTVELLTLESMQYCVKWTIEEQDPLFSVLQQIKYPKTYKNIGQ